MSLTSIIKEIFRTFTFWIPTKNPPKWVKQKTKRFIFQCKNSGGGVEWDTFAAHPEWGRYYYKIIYGKRRIYCIVVIPENWGITALTKYYWKPRIR